MASTETQATDKALGDVAPGDVVDILGDRALVLLAGVFEAAPVDNRNGRGMFTFQ